MPNQFAVPMTKRQAVTEDAEPALSQLAWEAGTATTPARVTVIMQAKDADGEWDNSYDPFKKYMEDMRDEDGTFPEPRLVFHAFGLMMDAIIPASDPRAQAMGVGGMTVRQMGEALIRQKLQEEAQGNTN